MQKHMSYGDDYHYVPGMTKSTYTGSEALTDLYSFTIQIANICFVGHPETHDYVLVDAGMPKSANKIITTAQERFGDESRPKAIILTHGHFDHVGSIVELVDYWDVPVYAHSEELPFLTGQKNYPEPDASVEGGMIAKMSPMFPNEAVNLGDHVEALPKDGSVPHMEGWRWIHTPGHTPGHISLFRDEDRALIAGDAFITVKQDSLFKVLMQTEEINGPPIYFTTDWEAAWESVKKLQDLNPSVAVTGHGRPSSGERLSDGLEQLVDKFYEIGMPEYGKYVKRNRYKH